MRLLAEQLASQRFPAATSFEMNIALVQVST
jgi:hypothetical protein